MRTREDLEAMEDRALSPYAARSRESRGRAHPEPEHAYRTAFQRDRDRVVHCTAFRRLEYKTQVFVNHEGDYYRTRLTHSMETAQVARTAARALGLNEDLAEALALSHDLGHPPFGHSGQDALAECMKAHGGFEHNAQSLRIVEILERRYPDFPGLNLTWEVRESMRKHTIRPDHPVPPEFEPGSMPLLEAQLVDVADSVAYDAHDTDDALKAGLVAEADFRDIRLFRDAAATVDARWPGLAGDLRRVQTVVAMINLVVTDLVETTEKALRESGIRTAADVRRAGRKLVRFSAPMADRREELERFLFDRVYRHYRVVRMQEKARRFLVELFNEYLRNEDQLPPHFRAWAREVGGPRAVADYIAGMTDRYAQEEYKKFFHPFERV